MDESDRMALDVISLPLWEEPALRRRRRIMSTTTNNDLTQAEREVLKNLNISEKELSGMKLAQQERENTASSGEDATQTIFRALGIKQDELPHARMAREGASGDKQLAEKVSDLIHFIGVASEKHARRTGSPSISLMCAAQIARDLEAQFKCVNTSGGDQGDDSGGDNHNAQGGLPMLNRVASHARMPGAHKTR